MSADPLQATSGSRFGADPAASGTAPSRASGAWADSKILELADQCVMCGLCLPHCPTYRISLDEAESPRGRIALARSLASGRIAPGPAALTHLDQCLACLSCESVCPSEVRYGAIITRTRAALARARARRGGFGGLLNDPDRLVALARLGALLHAHRWMPGLARWLPRTSRSRALAAQVPDVPPKPSFRSIDPVARNRGAVTLFRGCVASVYERDTHAAARVLLEALGYDVRIPNGTPCCGALARHAGEEAAADRQSESARRALAEAGAATVLVTATGCFGDLRDHASGSSGPAICDILAFLARDAELARLRFRPLDARAALHLPCTQVNVVGEIASIRSLLARIPGLTVLDLPLQPRCCGAAGSYFVEHPAIAERLRTEKLAQVDAERPDLVLTTNIGCRIHLANGLRERSAAPPVLHPLALLAQQLENGRP
jgi:glycolate oxidase iron-sulfur subunit